MTDAQEVTPQLRRAFEDSYSDKSILREILRDFEDVGIQPSAEPESASWGGQRRRLVARLYAGVDWSSADQVQRVLAAWATHMRRLEDRHDHEEFAKLQKTLGRNGLQYHDGIIARREPGQPSGVEHVVDLWPPDQFRLFLSHVSSFKLKTALLKRELARYNVSGFVAHEDIEPSLQWEQVIEQALREMDALAALLTDGFHTSKWTDQEVGYAIGRGTLVVAIRRDVDPYGFMARHQALNSRGKDAAQVARELVRLLSRHPLTKEKMGNALAARLARSLSFQTSRDIAELLELAAPLSTKAREIVEAGFRANSEVRFATGVPQILSELTGKTLVAEDD